MAILEVKDLKKSFDNQEILKGISFEMEKGQTLSILGSSGSGKTTLLRCLNFLETPDAGTISVNGNLLFDGAVGHEKGVDLREKRLHFGMVFQQFNLFPQYTALENVTLAPKLEANGKSDEEIIELGKELLVKMGLEDRMNNYPHQLSGGQQQRTAIARALANNPTLVLADEPTGALDSKNGQEVMDLLMKSVHDIGQTLVIITHNMDLAREADRIVKIKDGEIEN